jgi:hypothetical protein
MTQEAREDRLLGVLCLTARTSIDRLLTTMRGALLGSPAYEPVRCQERPPGVRAVAVDAFSPVLRGPRGREDRAC